VTGLPGQIGQTAPGGLIADREDEVHHRRAGAREFMPAFAAQSACRQMELFKQVEGHGVHPTFWKLPALYPLNRSLPQCSISTSARMLPAELPVQRKRTL
jgi:hypothetical protein